RSRRAGGRGALACGGHSGGGGGARRARPPLRPRGLLDRVPDHVHVGGADRRGADTAAGLWAGGGPLPGVFTSGGDDPDLTGVLAHRRALHDRRLSWRAGAGRRDLSIRGGRTLVSHLAHRDGGRAGGIGAGRAGERPSTADEMLSRGRYGGSDATMT